MEDTNNEPIQFSLTDISSSAVPEVNGLKIKKLIQIIPLGVPRIVDKRKLKVTDEDLDFVLEDLKTRKNPVACIYSHGKSAVGEEAAGWFESFTKTSKGLYGLIDWLPETVEKIRSGKFKFLSPSFLPAKDKEGFLRPRVLVEASLTNIAAIDGMEPVEANITLEQELTEMMLSEQALALLGLPATASDAEIDAMIVAKLSPEVEAPKIEIEVSIPVVPCTTSTETTEIKEEKNKPETDTADKIEALSVEPEPVITVPVPVTTEAAATVELSTSTEAKEEQLTPIAVEVPASMESMSIEKLQEVVEFKVSERLHEIKITNLLDKLENEGKIIPATRKSFSSLAHADYEAFSVVSSCLKQVAPVKSVVSGKKLNVPLEGFNTGDFYTKAVQLSVAKNISVQDALESLHSN